MKTELVYQPQYQIEKLKRLIALNMNFAQQSANGQELAILALGHDEVGRLPNNETLYIDALRFLAPVSRALNDGIASKHKLRTVQKATVKHKISIIMYLREKIRYILKLHAMNPPYVMLSMVGSPNAAR